jgi:uncharacterized protein involved in outer membrane biogenesis
MSGASRRAWQAAAAAAATAMLLVAAGEAAGWPWLRAPLGRALAAAAGVPVALDGPFRTRLLWRPHLQVGHLRVAGAQGVPVPHLLDGQDVGLAWRWRDVWRWQRGARLRLAALRVGRIDAHLLRLPDGRASWQLAQAAPAPGGPQGRSLDTLPQFGTLEIGQGRVAFDDPLTDTALQAVIQAPEGGTGVASAAGYRAEVSGRLRAQPLQLQLRAGGALPWLKDGETSPAWNVRRVQAGAAPVSLHVQGVAGATLFSFDGQAADLLGARMLDGNFRLRGASLDRAGRPFGLTLPATPRFDADGTLAHGAGVWHLVAERAVVGGSVLAGDFRFDQRVTPPRLEGRLRGPRLALAELGPAVGGPAGGRALPDRAGRRLLPQRELDLSSLRAMDADVKVAIDELDLGSPALAPLRSLQTQLRLHDGVLQLQRLQATVAGGRIEGAMELDALRQPARWTAALRIDDVDVAGWLRAPALAAGLTGELTGELSGELDLGGQGLSAAAVLATLDGHAWLALREGTLAARALARTPPDLARALGWPPRAEVPLRCAGLQFVSRGGVVQPRLTLIAHRGGALRASGRIDLRDETLALSTVVQTGDGLPPSRPTRLKVGGSLAAPTIGLDLGSQAGPAAPPPAADARAAWPAPEGP